MKSFILGVTGVIGSGKSTLCRFLEEKHGFRWIDADKIVHELYLFGQPGYQKIKEYFGAQFVGPTQVHRGRLRRLVLKTPEKLWILNKVMHPLVAHEVRKRIAKSSGKICLEAIYFEEHDLGKFIDRLLIVDAPESVLLKRLKSRDISEQHIKTLIKFQKKNAPKSGIVIHNDKDLAAFFAAISAALSSIVK